MVATRPRSAASRRTPDRTPNRRRSTCPVPGAALDLLALARRGWAEADLAGSPTARYAAAHLAALRGAAAVLAARTRPVGRRSPRNVWVLLAEVSPELAEWAAFFAAGAGKRAAAEAGLTRAVSRREADDLLRAVETFLLLVETTVGLPGQPVLPAAVGSAAAGGAGCR